MTTGEQHSTIMASEVLQKITELVAEYSDQPMFFMEPMNGNALPMSSSTLEIKDGRIEIWPA